MSQLLERAIRRQRAIQQSRSAAWLVFATASVTGLFALGLLGALVAAGLALSLTGVVTALITGLAGWFAVIMFGEARRLGRLLEDPERIMLAKHTPDLDGGLQWSSLNPFSGRRR